ncbi:cobalamin-independent methionine synthase II family protein [Arthrobacter sp. zg-Y20]|uniref:cobalamin-independent methionine synthase II family protein n=1 Tax=unclassified Arthrobacter TaxID=235627 RepID=UPI001D1362EC|nr:MULTISPECIES: cobalamin-independent methionine synthase II family protein [unclassified Arthrobacter]MCC3275812.1 cobalamin-independent methionine synthase II family protein [Arthrobacter sp. zg-Y20]MDK1315969.1 cobalamin-independent methionine synthase II family protein [Arthrobacter sp. zg.Y20]WIB06254.1 cobalamin-independent methionine synthase II family protein [Arthrobacter sp. zg-Y20]
MRKSTDRILATHAGSLPRTPELLAANAARDADPSDTGGYAELLSEAVADLVLRQQRAGIDIPNDGEYGHSMSAEVDYGAWWSYSFARLSGLTVAETGIWEMEPVRSEPGKPVLTSFGDRRDRGRFREAYTDPSSGITTGAQKVFPKVTGKVEYTGYDAVAGDIRNLKSGLAAAGLEEGFLASLSPGSCSRIANEYYATEEEFIYACADAMREEYKAIIDAGLIVQIDDPSIAENWDQINPEPSVEDYLRFTEIRVEALNYALRGLPEEQIRFHLCWGSWHGPHTTDIEFRHLADTLLKINAGGYSFEAGNVRHEHEWRVWEDTKLPDGKVIIPGVVSHATNVVEHPQLVADRIERFARLVGRENVIASTDCGLGGRVHPQIAAAKLEALGEGARLASSRLW